MCQALYEVANWGVYVQDPRRTFREITGLSNELNFYRVSGDPEAEAGVLLAFDEFAHWSAAADSLTPRRSRLIHWALHMLLLPRAIAQTLRLEVNHMP